MKVRRLTILIVVAALIVCALLFFGSWKWGWGRGEGEGDAKAPEGAPATARPAAGAPKQPCKVRVDRRGIWIDDTPKRAVDTDGAVSYCKLQGGRGRLEIIFDAPHGLATQVEQAFATAGLDVEIVRPR